MKGSKGLWLLIGALAIFSVLLIIVGIDQTKVYASPDSTDERIQSPTFCCSQAVTVLESQTLDLCYECSLLTSAIDEDVCTGLSGTCSSSFSLAQNRCLNTASECSGFSSQEIKT